MSSYVSGVEIAGLIFEYLQDQKLDKVAREFCQASPYLREQHSCLKRGLNIKRLNTIGLIDIFKAYIEIRDLVCNVFNTELKGFAKNPELTSSETLDQKVELAFRWLIASKNTPSTSTSTSTNTSSAPEFVAQKIAPSLKRKCSPISQNDFDTDSSSPSPEATSVQDLPGYRYKRRKLFDPKCVLNNRSDAMGTTTTTVSEVPVVEKINTPLKFSSEGLSNTFQEHRFENVIAESINSAINNQMSLIEQLDSVMPNILQTTETNPTYEDIIRDALENANGMNDFDCFDTNSKLSTSTPSKCSGMDEIPNEPMVEEQLNTPDPNNESIKQRLRPRKSNTTDSTTRSTESKPKSKANNIQVISNEYIGTLPAVTAGQSSAEVIVVNSDPEDTVTTTVPSTNNWYLTRMTDPITQENMFIVQVHPKLQAQSSTAPISEAYTNFNFPSCTITNSASQSNMNEPIPMFINLTDDNSFQIEGIEYNRTRIIEVDGNEMNSCGSGISQPNAVFTETGAGIEIVSTVTATETITENVEKSVEQHLPIDFEFKAATPKQQIKTNIPTSSRSLSTPSHKNTHVRILDFDTPMRSNLSKVFESKHEGSAFNASKLLAVTPHNQSIAVSLPGSAPAKVNPFSQSIKISRKPKAIETITEESSSVDTVISVSSDTPKVGNKKGRSCVRTLSSHKDINAKDRDKRFKRVAKTKKKICDGNDDAEQNEESTKPAINEPEMDPVEQWELEKLRMKDPKLFEQHLRESESQKQALNRMNEPNKRKSRRNQKKTPARPKRNLTGNKNVKTSDKSNENLSEKSIEKSSEKSVELSNASNDVEKSGENSKEKSIEKSVDLSIVTDISMNSANEESSNNTQLRLDAQTLEDLLRSAKKPTPVKQSTRQIKKKKTPAIKLTPRKMIKNAKSKKTPKGKSAKGSCIESDNKETEPKIDEKHELDQQPVELTSVDSTLSNNSTHEDLEVAKDLINMQDVILQQEKVKNRFEQTTVEKIDEQPKDSIESVPSTSGIVKPISAPNPIVTIQSFQLETPLKFDSAGLMFPKTPGVNSILPQLVTPMIKTDKNILDVSLFKNPQFPTPSFPITPGSIFTPLKDLNSPRSDQDVVYGAINRPTDYSSSSSYYKPDESDGIDKQIQASVRSTRTNSGIYSADEFECNEKDNEDSVTNKGDNSQLDSSSSSSGSSSSDDSDSDSSDSSSSDSDASQISQKSTPNLLTPSIESVIIEEDSTQKIKSHLISTNEVGIAQNILLIEPEISSVNKEAEKAETRKQLETKRLRTQEIMRKVEIQNSEKNVKPKPAGKSKLFPAKRNERFRSLPASAVGRSPSKRKSTLPQKYVSTHAHVQVVDQKGSQPQSIITQQVISEAISDNANPDTSNVNAKEPIAKCKEYDEENIEAIADHLKQMKNDAEMSEKPATAKNESIAMTKKNLVETLEGKKETLREKAKRDQSTTMMLTSALPLKKVPRSRNAPKIQPISGYSKKDDVKKGTEIKELNTRTTRAATKRANSVEIEKREQKQQQPEPSTSNLLIKVSTPLKTVAKEPPSKVQSEPSVLEVKEVFETPAKDRHNRQMRDMFGDMTDIETPIKSPPRMASRIPDPPKTIEKSEPIAKPVNSSQDKNKFKADSSTTNASFSSLSTDEYTTDDDDDDDEEEDEFDLEMVYSIDETDKKRFREFKFEDLGPRTKSKNIQTDAISDSFKRTVCVDDIRVVLTVSQSEDELYAQDVVAHSSPEMKFEKPLRSSTPSPSPSKKSTTLSPKPKINIKHKNKDSKSKEERQSSNRLKKDGKMAQGPPEKALRDFDVGDIMDKLKNLEK